MDGMNGVSNLTLVESINTTSGIGLLCSHHHDVHTLVRFVCDVIFNIPISIVGLVGNSLAFVVLLQHESLLGTTLLLQTLAITDNVVIIVRFFLYTLPTIDSCRGGLSHYMAHYGTIFRWLYPFVFFVRMLEVGGFITRSVVSW
jgi:hypothetical protein